MQVKRMHPQMDAILEVFKELNLEDTEVQKQLLELAKSSDWYPLGKLQKAPQDTRNNTLPEEQDAELEPTS